MEIAKLQPSGVRIKTKQAIFLIAPTQAKGKQVADVVLLFDKSHENLPEFEESVLIVDGPGDYEVKSVKFSGIGKGDNLYYFGKLDGIDVLAIKTSIAQKVKENVKECNIAIVDADAEVDESVIAALGANAVVFYGVAAEETIKKLGKSANTTSKYAVTKDKLPSEMEVILLS